MLLSWIVGRRPRRRVGRVCVSRALAPFETLERRLALADLPAGFTESLVADGLAAPTAMEIAPDGRIFVTEQAGRLRVIQNGVLLSNAFLTLDVNSSGERGLLGVAFDPNFADNQFVYVYYTTASSPVHNRVSRFTANGNAAVPGSETVIADLNNLSSATNHNGGAIHFGLDGKLYVAVGDNANPANAQTLNNRLGKMLRLNSDGSIPTDNPFYQSATGLNRAIWALGLRNPFTFAVQPGTGRIFINDVGQNSFEEINDGVAGSNYGWPHSEGTRRSGDTEVSIGSYRNPLFSYNHNIGPTGGCAVTGGAFYNPVTAQFPASFSGDYFFADLCSSWIRTFDPATSTVADFASNLPDAPVDLKIDEAGNLYYLTRGFGSTTGQLTRVQYANASPEITQQPADRRVAAGQSATFNANASGATPLAFQWQRNGTNIPGANSNSLHLAATNLDEDGDQFRVVVTNSFGTATSDPALLTVVDNDLPTADITVPGPGTNYSAGDTISFAGTGSDPEDGSLPVSAFTWEVVFHHAQHVHPFILPFGNAGSGSFVIPSTGETATDVFYRIHLTVTDSFGFTGSTFVDVHPTISQMRLETSPAGLNLLLDGIATGTPSVISSVVGMDRTLGIPPVNVLGGVHYEFVSWSHGGAAEQTVATPGIDSTFTANFQRIGRPHVTDLRVEGSKRSRRLVIEFDKPLDPTSAMNAANYRISEPGRDRRFHVPARPSNDDQLISFDPPSYQAMLNESTMQSTGRVTIPVPRGISNNDFFLLTIDGTISGAGDSALRGINGDVLDGELPGSFPSGNGSSGGDFSALVGAGTSLAYLDATGDSVSLDLKRQGSLTIVRRLPQDDGERSDAIVLRLDETSSRSKLRGRVRGGQTAIDRIVGLAGVSNNIQGNPSFAVGQISAALADRLLDELFHSTDLARG